MVSLFTYVLSLIFVQYFKIIHFFIYLDILIKIYAYSIKYRIFIEYRN